MGSGRRIGRAGSQPQPAFTSKRIAAIGPTLAGGCVSPERTSVLQWVTIVARALGLVLAVVAAILANVALFLAVYARSFNAQLESLGGEAHRLRAR